MEAAVATSAYAAVPLLPLQSRRRSQNAVGSPSFAGLHTKSLLNTTALSFRTPFKKSSLGKLQDGRPKLSKPGLAVPYKQHQLPLASMMCAAALNTTCSTGQTQTVTRQASTTKISLLPGTGETPKLEKGGDGGPPYYGGGGGGGGGGSPSSGGFFLFAFLLFLRFLKEKDKDKESAAPVLLEEE